MDIVLRAAIAFVVLWLLTKAAGRATLGELSSFDLLLFITMGDLIQQGITGEDRTLTGGLVAVATFALLAVIFNLVVSRWSKASRLLEGPPIILVADGRALTGAMRRQRVSVAEILSAGRQSGYENMSDIRLAVLEQDGKISFFPYTAEHAQSADQE
ncbi:DUF421 domain-containing protein [Flaviflexus equikiangi]|uniref:DUF421 domain-containing protein n=1 Tax=Flaviflexus equikiangi TaxID=2758573 RepID=A0ABS2TCZ8_9ACTO|nr:YetF domain-containing protein [Flaviflexus equikiangi]MBM9432529.1 DUF421 domain-containing protein [Flaviflexus equikiangi]